MVERTLLRDVFFGALIFAMLSAGVVGLLNLVTTDCEKEGCETINLFRDSNREEVELFNRTFNIQNRIMDNVSTLRTQIEELTAEPDLNAITLSVAFVKSAWVSIKTIIRSFGFMTTAIGGLESFLGIPTWFTVLAIGVLTTILIFAILSMIFGKNI